MKVQIQWATEHDLPEIQAIYAHHVLNDTGTFEEEPPTIDAIQERWLVRESNHHPTFVACADKRVVGFAYASFYKTRSAYRYTVEDSVYVGHDVVGRGIGQQLLARLIVACAERQFKQMMAVIGDSNNRRSIALHQRCGFTTVGTAKRLGYKFDQWLDVVYMQRTL